MPPPDTSPLRHNVLGSADLTGNAVLNAAVRVADESNGNPPGRSKKTRWAWLVATFFGAGFLRPGPGTYGSLAAAILWLLAGWIVHHNTQTLTLITSVGIIVGVALGIPAATRVARESGRADPGFVVIDEVAGQWIALLFMPPLWPNALMAVLLFRFFDILKPPPIRRFEALPEGTGIVVDDLAAGAFALVLGQLILHLLARLH